MKKLLLLSLLIAQFSIAQDKVELVLKDSIQLKAKKLFGTNGFDTFYYTTKDFTFHKKIKDTVLTYTNFQLGEITSVNAFNPLKINLFYENFNTVVVLDNRFAEIFKIDFNTNTTYKNISHVSTGYDNSIWIFNVDTQQLELYDYKSNKTKLKSTTIQSEILDLKSDYNYAYLLSQDFLYVYNYFGSLVGKYKNDSYTKMAFCKAFLILQKENTLHLLNKNTSEISSLRHSKMLINQFLVTNESLYLYRDNYLLKYQLKIN